jgi:protein-S-isoprenylcysteine O-methyltransferase Ste14
MSELFTPEGSLALAIAALQLVLGWRFTLPERGRDVAGFLTYAAAVAVGFAAGRGLVGASPPLPAPLAMRVAGAALLVCGLLLAGASQRARLLAGRGRLATAGAYARIRHPLYLGLVLVLAGGWLRAPSAIGGLLAAIAAAQYVWLGFADERATRDAFGASWSEYAGRTRAIWPVRSKA